MCTQGQAGPSMTRHVGREGNIQSELITQHLEFSVYQMGGTFILPAFIGMHVADNGQQVGGIGRSVFIHNLLHGAFPFNHQTLTGLLTTIAEHTMAQVTLAKEGHVDERHATRIERKHKEVACIVHQRLAREVQLSNLPDGLYRYGPFHCFVNTRIDMFERGALSHELRINRPIVDGAQIAHVEGDGILTDSPPLEPRLVLGCQ